MGSTFTRFQNPAHVDVDHKPMSSWPLLSEDSELVLRGGRERYVPLPIAAPVHPMVVRGISRGMDQDLVALLTKAHEESGQTIEPDNREIDDGLGES